MPSVRFRFLLAEMGECHSCTQLTQKIRYLRYRRQGWGFILMNQRRSRGLGSISTVSVSLYERALGILVRLLIDKNAFVWYNGSCGRLIYPFILEYETNCLVHKKLWTAYERRNDWR